MFLDAMCNKNLLLIICLFCGLLFLMPAGANAVGNSIAKDKLIEEKIDSLMKQMTLKEKVGQVTQYMGALSPDGEADLKKGMIGSVFSIQMSPQDLRKRTNELQRIAVNETRLHIPLIIGHDVVHGLWTVFPTPLAIGASFDPECARIMARVSASEARAVGINWTFAPMIDIARDARWGRTAEGCGEDPYLTSIMGAAMVKGFQGDNLSAPDSVAACAKHFVAYGDGEGGRDYETVDVSNATLFNVYLPPYKAAVDAGVQSVMASFNEINGTPMTCNSWLLRDVLKKRFGFDGFVESDYEGVSELMNHRVAKTRADCAMLAMNGGLDMEMLSNCYRDNLEELVKTGKVKESVLDDAVRRILRVKFRLGLFENPYAPAGRIEKIMLCPEYVADARKAAQESIVLIKNNNSILPLSKNIGSLAVIGFLADDNADVLGTWSGLGRSEDTVSILQGIKKAVSPDTIVRYAQGYKFSGRYFEKDRLNDDNNTDGFNEALDAVKQSDAAVVVLGENGGMSGEAASRDRIELSNAQEQLIEKIYAAGKPVVVVLMSGRALAIPWIADNIPSILEVWHGGIQAGNAVADVLFGDYNPGGKLPVTFPKSTGQCPTYYGRKNAGRPVGADKMFAVGYMNSEYVPVYPFGYGLSYTTFEYSNLKIDPVSIGRKGTLRMSADVKNTGARQGDEVVQLYISDTISSITRPVKELKGFKRITLQPGETKNVEFKLKTGDIGYYNNDGKIVLEPGEFEVWIGGSSASGLNGVFNLTNINK